METECPVFGLNRNEKNNNSMETWNITGVVKAEIANSIELIRTSVQPLMQNLSLRDTMRNPEAHSIRECPYVLQIIISRYYDTPYW